MNIEYNVGDEVKITSIDEDLRDMYYEIGIKEGMKMNIDGIKIEDGKVYIKLKSKNNKTTIWNTDCSFRKIK